MSSSAPKRQAEVSEQEPVRGLSQQPSPEVSPFAYLEVDPPNGAAGSSFDAAQAAEERIRRQRAEAFEQGRQDAQKQLRTELDAALAQHREPVARALRKFALERQSYYRRIEAEVVALALAIARKILHRELQIDPQALAGIVRVTLEKLDIGTKVNLHVHPREAADWRRYFASQPEGVPTPDVHEDPAIAPGECRIETSLGSTEVGLESQLKEIETGLLDLLAERPGASAPSPTLETR